MRSLELQAVSVDRGGRRLVDGIDLRLLPGERLGLLGVSGSGKSTLLKLAAGLLAPSAGLCRNTFAHPLLVFQEPRLLPWRRVRANVEIPLRAAGVGASEARRRAGIWLERVGLGAHADVWPGQLSGGMAQRAALARAFALEPDLLLLDEPFSALDPGLRASLGEVCDTLLAGTGAAMICVSHHPDELVGLVDRCALLGGGAMRCFDINDGCPGHGRSDVAAALNTALLHSGDPAP